MIGTHFSGRRAGMSSTVFVGCNIRSGGIPGGLDGFNGIVGDGDVVRRARPVLPFNRIELSSAIDIEVTFGQSLSMELEADANLHDLIDAKVEAGTLSIGVTGSLTTENALTMHVQLPHSLEAVHITGSGDANLHGLKQEQINLHIQGSGDIRASGVVRKVHGLIQGSGDLKLKKLLAEDADLTVQGSGDIGATVSKSATATVQGSGDITIFGNPPIRRTHVAGSGDIEFEED